MTVFQIKTMKTIALILTASVAMAIAADAPTGVAGSGYSDKKFYFAAWGAPDSGPEAAQQARLAKLAEAGITDSSLGTVPND